jgi:AcrR family transcriptional regulator
MTDAPTAPTAGEGARARARRELLREITDAARVQLAEVGAAALSVRAVTRTLGMAPSAVYRYFPNRDALLTALITDAYVGLGDAAARAEAAVPRDDLRGRWLAVHRAVRDWALDRPHEYALIYGSPVPGYRAPEDTVAPAARVALLLATVAVDAWTTGASTPQPGAGTAAVPSALLDDAHRLLEYALAGYPQDRRPEPGTVDLRLPLAVVDAWTELFGCVGFELFGHYRGVVEARAEHLDAVALRTAAAVGLPGPGAPTG